MNRFFYQLILGLLLITSSQYVFSQTSWEQKLSKCEIVLKIKGSSKYDLRDEKIAKKYEGQELIWLHFEKSIKKSGNLKPIRVYLISEKMENGQKIEYIIPVEDYKNKINAAIFPEWKSKKNKFYLATCFDNIYKP